MAHVRNVQRLIMIIDQIIVVELIFFDCCCYDSVAMLQLLPRYYSVHRQCCDCDDCAADDIQKADDVNYPMYHELN